MSRWRRARAQLCLAGILGIFGGTANAQSIAIAVSSLKSDSMPPAPIMSVTAIPGPPQFGPYSITLELSTEPQFRQPFYVNVSDSLSTQFTIDSLIPEHTPIFFRARLFDRLNAVQAEAREQHPVLGWVRLISPRQVPLENLTTRKPQFVWSSPSITLPPGFWTYDLTVINTGSGIPAFSAPGLLDTSFTFADSLEANTSYRWQVRARAQNSRGTGEVTVRSAGSFIIASADRPTVTLFFQNFPNPFGRGQRLPITCFWFDLARPTRVRLTIYSLSLRKVRTLIPGAIDGDLPAGAYGRQDIDTQSGCDIRFSWDGRDDGGNYVPAGVYIAEFQGDGLRTTRKILYMGR